jgi:hypothetical protein
LTRNIKVKNEQTEHLSNFVPGEFPKVGAKVAPSNFKFRHYLLNHISKHLAKLLDEVLDIQAEINSIYLGQKAEENRFEKERAQDEH